MDENTAKRNETMKYATGNAKTVYLAGKITGDPNYRQKFRAARRELERAGFIVLDPSILPYPAFEYEAYMIIGAVILDQCDAACFLGDWEDSNGARREHSQAEARGLHIF